MILTHIEKRLSCAFHPPAKTVWLAAVGLFWVTALIHGSAQTRSAPTLPGQDARVKPALTATPFPDPARRSTAPAGVLLSNVSASQEEGRLILTLSANASATYREFILNNPPRLVLDLENAENRMKKSSIALDGRIVRQVRVSQYRPAEPKILRVVFDMGTLKTAHQIIRDGTNLRVIFSEPGRQTPPAKTAIKPVVALSNTLIVREIPAPATAERPSVAPPDPNQFKSGLAESSGPVQAKPAPQNTAAQPPQPSQSTPPMGSPLTLDLVDIPLIDFFRLMAEEGGINIVIDPEIKGSISIKVVKVPWDQIFDAALANNGLDRVIEGNLVRITKRTTLQEEAKQRELLKRVTVQAADLETKVIRLNYSKAASMIPTLVDQKSVRGTMVVDERTNALIMTDLPSYLEKVAALINELDVPQPQVQIEARIVSATREFARDIGVQFGFVQGNLQRVTVGGPNTFGSIGGTRPTATPTTTFAAGNPQTGRGAAGDTSTQSAGVSTGSSSQNAGNLNVNLPSQKAFGGIGVSIGNIIDTFLLDAAITAGENHGKAKLISQPKVTAQNNNAAQITQGLRFPVQIIANNTITVQFQNAALTLVVTPQITAEGKVVLDIQVENNTPDFSRTVNGIPSIRTSESKTRVLVTDGGTTVIGGILLENEQFQEDRVPGFASLPLVGNLFKRTAISRTTQEVLFFITPTIIK